MIEYVMFFKKKKGFPYLEISNHGVYRFIGLWMMNNCWILSGTRLKNWVDYLTMQTFLLTTISKIGVRPLAKGS